MFLDIVIVGLAAVLAVATYLCKRSAGVPILAMAAGAFAAQTAAPTLSKWLVSQGWTVTGVSLEALVGAAMILIPFVIAWLAGGKAKPAKRQLVGAVVVGIVGAALVLHLLPAIFREDLFISAKIDDLLTTWHDWIVTGGIAFALADLLLARSGSDKESRHHR